MKRTTLIIFITLAMCWPVANQVLSQQSVPQQTASGTLDKEAADKAFPAKQAYLPIPAETSPRVRSSATLISTRGTRWMPARSVAGSALATPMCFAKVQVEFKTV